MSLEKTLKRGTAFCQLVPGNIIYTGLQMWKGDGTEQRNSEVVVKRGVVKTVENDKLILFHLVEESPRGGTIILLN